MRLSRLLPLSAAILALGGASQAMAQAEPSIGQLMVVGYNFCPAGWFSTEGQLLPISQYSALFSLIGTTYGGNGQTTFALPDLRGRAPAHFGQGPGLPNVNLGQQMGVDQTALTISQMPAHSHSFLASSNSDNASTPAGNALGTFAAGRHVYAAGNSQTVAMSSQSIGSMGDGQPFDAHQPSLGMRFCIAFEGIFPQRN